VAVVIPLKLVYTPVDATVTAIRNYQVPSPEGDTVTVDEQLLNTEYCAQGRAADQRAPPQNAAATGALHPTKTTDAAAGRPRSS
jgi:hypothetical protein